MNYREYEFVLVGSKSEDSTTEEVDLCRVRAYTLQEALGDIYIRLSSLRSKNGKNWKIVKATDTTHFDNIASF